MCDAPTLGSAVHGIGGVSESPKSNAACKTTETMADVDTLWDAALTGLDAGASTVGELPMTKASSTSLGHRESEVVFAKPAPLCARHKPVMTVQSQLASASCTVQAKPSKMGELMHRQSASLCVLSAPFEY